jgi:hypothetical protein
MNPNPHQRPSTAVATIAPTSAEEAMSSKLLKSHRNKYQYQQRKADRFQAQVDTLKDKLVVATDQISDLQHTNTLSLRKAELFKAESDKASNLLSTRTE